MDECKKVRSGTHLVYSSAIKYLFHCRNIIASLKAKCRGLHRNGSYKNDRSYRSGNGSVHTRHAEIKHHISSPKHLLQ